MRLQPVAGTTEDIGNPQYPDQAAAGKQGAEEQHLQLDMSLCGIGELRQEGQKENRDLGVEQVTEHALPV